MIKAKIWWKGIGTILLTIGVLLGSLFCTGLSAQAASTRAFKRAIIPQANLIAQQVLQNVYQNGWNPQAQTKGVVTGGLYINWEMSNPSRTNALNGNVEADNSGSHDPQTDLYHLNNLVEYQYLNPQSTGFNADFARFLPLIKYEYANYNIPKGWVYFYLLRDAFFLNDYQLFQEAYNAASNYYNHWYDPNVGMVYNRAHTPGVVTVEHTVTSGVALIDAGLLWGNTQWLQAGESTLNTIIQAAFNQQAGLFYNNLAVQSNNTLTVTNDQAKAASQGSIVEALSEAYMLTHNQYYLTVAGRVLQSMFYASGLWDWNNGGLYFAYDLNSHNLEQSYKETRGQTHALTALYRYNQALLAQDPNTPPAYQYQEQVLNNLLLFQLYQPIYHGYVYRVTPTFQIYVSAPGKGIGVEDYFTSEAMGLALDALQQTELPNLSF